MQKIIVLTIGILSLTILSCSQPDETIVPTISTGSDVTILGNAHSIISGEVFGDGPSSIADNSKLVSITVNNPNPDLQIPSQVYAVKSYPDSNNFLITIEIKNVSASASYSFVSLENVFYLDSSGTPLNATGDITYCYGNIGEISIGYTDTCLFPGQTGVLILFEEFYDQLDSIQLDVGNSTSPTDVLSAVTGDDYSYSSDEYHINVGFHNNDAARLDMDTSPLYIIRNSDDIPVDWGYGNSSTFIPSDGNMDVSTSGSVQLGFDNEYTASKVEICFGFDVFTASSISSTLTTVRNIPLTKYEILKNRIAQLSEFKKIVSE